MAYRRLIDLYYQKEESLVGSIEEIARKIRMKGSEEEVGSVLREFFSLVNGQWTHERCDAEIARMKGKQEKAKASAGASVKARQANAQRTLNERSTEVELPKSQEPTPTPKKEKRLSPSSEKPDSFKKWGEEELRCSVSEANQEGILLESEIEDFICYWVEPSSSGRPRFTLEKTWETKRRMKTAVRVIYEKRRAPPLRTQDVGQRVVSGAEQTRKYLNELYAD